MVADGYDDCEGDIIARVRGSAPGAAIGVELDPHCHLTRPMVDNSDLIIIAKEYPHIDFSDRAVELYVHTLAIGQGRLRPVAAVVDTAMVGFYPTFDPPMKDLVDDLRALEGRPGVISASLVHGFPWADVAEVGTQVLIYTDNDPDLAEREALRLGRKIYDLRDELLPRLPDIGASLDRQRTHNGRTVLGDFADNPGGGAPGDSTFFLKEMLDRKVEHAVIGAFWDPVVAHIAGDAGVGARLRVRLGGKCGPTSGDPLDLDVEVMAVKDNHSQGVFGQRQPMGLCVWLRCQDIDIVVASIRSQVFEPDLFTDLGVTLEDKRLIVVKSANHYQAGFRADADHLWHVRSPGAMGLDFAAMPYTQRHPVYHPKVDDPWAVLGPPKAFVKAAVARPAGG
jgi:microcystin degradation protein MlrC